MKAESRPVGCHHPSQPYCSYCTVRPTVSQRNNSEQTKRRSISTPKMLDFGSPSCSILFIFSMSIWKAWSEHLADLREGSATLCIQFLCGAKVNQLEVTLARSNRVLQYSISLSKSSQKICQENGWHIGTIHACVGLKFGDSGMSLWVKQNVFWLQVSINDVAFVQSFHHQKNWPYVEPWMHHWKEGLADSSWFIHIVINVFVQSHWWTLTEAWIWGSHIACFREKALVIERIASYNLNHLPVIGKMAAVGARPCKLWQCE